MRSRQKSSRPSISFLSRDSWMLRETEGVPPQASQQRNASMVSAGMTAWLMHDQWGEVAAVSSDSQCSRVLPARCFVTSPGSWFSSARPFYSGLHSLLFFYCFGFLSFGRYGGGGPSSPQKVGSFIILWYCFNVSGFPLARLYRSPPLSSVGDTASAAEPSIELTRLPSSINSLLIFFFKRFSLDFLLSTCMNSGS